MRLRGRLGVSVAFLAVLAGSASGQTVDFSVAALGCRARDHVIFQNLRESVEGLCTGGVGYLKLGPVVIEATGLRAPELRPFGGSATFTRDGGDVRAFVGLAPVPWVVLEGGFGLRAFSSPAGYQRWQMLSGGLKIAVPLGDPALTAYLRGHYLPATPQQVPAGQPSGDAKWDLGLIAESGLRIAPHRVPLVFGVFYRLERFDFPGGTAGRLEQFDVLAIYGGLRLAK
ncbi:MAG: hypothetical protein KatS3mg081_2598 [Gemmatimonadales bacterium]|nr:MAG: hypothetical protein KatS3mg081_2598 [Gemmatimonadales bacterium]